MVVRPDVAIFEEMIEIVRVGDFKKGKGWGGTGIGNWWGGATFQGLVPYYYFKVASKHNPAVEVDRCIYNQMVDREIAPPSRGPPFVGQVHCRRVPLVEIKNVHFTLCQVGWVRV